MDKKRRRVSSYVVCPYYRSEDEKEIYCEGCEDKNSIHLGFLGLDRLKNYQARYCKTEWENCLIARALTDKWKNVLNEKSKPETED